MANPPFDWFDFLAARSRMIDIFHEEGKTDVEIAQTMCMTGTQVTLIRGRDRSIDIRRVDAERVMLKTIFDAYAKAHPEIDGNSSVTLNDIVTHICEVVGDTSVTTYSATYIEALQNAVADIATDGKRFRTLMWLFHDSQGEPTEAFMRAAEHMDVLDPQNIDDFRVALDSLFHEGFVPVMPTAMIDSGRGAEKLRQQALMLAAAVVNQHGRVGQGGPMVCIHCKARVEEVQDEFLAPNPHAQDCPVNLALQIIEDQQ